MQFTLFNFLLVLSLSAQAQTEIGIDECKKMSDVAQTRPAKANINKIKADLQALKDIKGRQVLTEISKNFENDLRSLFERDPATVSKLEQFYGLLYLIGRYKSIEDRRVDFNPDDVRKLLFSSQVFSQPDVPKAIKSVTLFWAKAFKKATYAVSFSEKELRLPLNEGRGFATFKEGLCQIAQALIFYGGFEFDVEQTSKSNFYVSKFKDVDLYGVFGSRGVADVDINFVSIKSVEFLKGSPMGIVRAKVSRKEFEVNSHSVLLKLVTNFVTDKSTQPIDW